MPGFLNQIPQLVLLIGLVSDTPELPVPLDDRLVIELVAREPEIRTPTGIAVDSSGRVWVIENNTHFRPDGYPGHPSDRIVIFDDFGADGRARRSRTFAEGLRDSMALAVGRPGELYLATRSKILLLQDRNADGVADHRQVLVRLETSGTYPHNGLSGLAFDARGRMVFSLGENLGAAYELIGCDGSNLSGGGEGGSIYRCRPDGSGLERVASGFWNPFALAFDAFGRLFAVDNDPDNRPPCRLLHIVPGGDYGYRFRNGRRGLHPFTAWNGELPGTLPMVAGTSEAPSGLVAYESDGLPQDYHGTLLATSWGDHRIERFRLSERGASLVSHAQTIVQGTEQFRPVGIALAPDGSLVLSDWVDKSYPVHGLGRIWRIRANGKTSVPALWRLEPQEVAALPLARIQKLLEHPDRRIRVAAGLALAEKGQGGVRILTEVLQANRSPRSSIHALRALARLEPNRAVALVQQALLNPAPEVRAEAVGYLSDVQGSELAEARLLELATTDSSPWVRTNAVLQLRSGQSALRVLPLLSNTDPFLVGAAIEMLSRTDERDFLLKHAENTDPRVRLGV